MDASDLNNVKLLTRDRHLLSGRRVLANFN